LVVLVVGIVLYDSEHIGQACLVHGLEGGLPLAFALEYEFDGNQVRQ
jgi:hypothetical protein